MKKALPLIFAFSLTAGTVCLGYLKAKDYKIKKLIALWTEQSKKNNKTLDTALLTTELEKLNLYDIHLLMVHTKKALAPVSTEELKASLEKLNKRKIPQRANLRSLEGSVLSA